MTRRRRITMLILVVPVVAIVAEWTIRPMLNPLRRSPDAIAASLLEKTPPGTSRAEVVAWADAQGYGWGGRLTPIGAEVPVQRLVGTYSTYGFIVSVFAEWVFDENGRLVTVEVYKGVMNAP